MALPDVDRAKRDAIREIVQVFGPVDVISHSKHAIDLIPVVREQPDSFRNIALVAPGGVHPGRGFFAVLRNLVMGDRRDHRHKSELKKAGGLTSDLIEANSRVSKVYRGSKLRVLLENLTSARVSINQYFPELQRKGVRIVIVAQEEDAFFQPHYLNPEGEQIPGVERYEVFPGFHGAMKFIPESCKRVVEVLKDMESNN